MQKLSKSKISFQKAKIRLAKRKDSRFIFQIYNENILNKNFFSKKKINYKEHKIWFENKIKEKLIFICSYKIRIGYIRYDFFKKKKLSISIAIKDKFKRYGFGKIMLKKTLSYKKIAKNDVYAFVKKNNLSSKKFFMNCGFKKIKNNAYLIRKNEK